MKRNLLLTLVALAPQLALAQALTLQNFITNFLQFTNNVLIPFLLGLAFLLFIINAVRFFVIGGSNEDGQKKAKSLALYSVLAFVVLVIFWGMVNLFANSLGLAGQTAPTPDYLQK